MNLIWHTALSVFDLGSSLLYSLLGRDLTEAEIALVELFFRYMRKTKYVRRQSAIKKKRNLMDINHLETGDAKQLILEMRTARLNLSCLMDDFLSKYDLKSKDLLLISSRRNGYNLLQLSIESLLAASYRWLDNAYKFYLNNDCVSIEAEYDQTILQHMQFVEILLEKYGCDPNRGILLSNKSKYTIGFSASEDEEDDDEMGIADEGGDRDEHQINANNIRLRLSAQQQKIHKSMQKAASSSSISGTIFSQTSNLNLKSVTGYTDELSLKELNHTPIDNPLLIICCVYSCHNLLNQAAIVGSINSTTGGNIASNESCTGSTVDLTSCRSSKSRRASEYGRKCEHSNGTSIKTKDQEKMNSSKMPFTSIASSIREPNKNYYKRRHTIHCDNAIDLTSCAKPGSCAVATAACQSGAAKSNQKSGSNQFKGEQTGNCQTPMIPLNPARRRIKRYHARKLPHSCNSSILSSPTSSVCSSNRNGTSYRSDLHSRSRSPNESNQDDENLSSSCSSKSSRSCSKSSSSSSISMPSSSSGKSDSSSSSRASTEVHTQLPTHCPSCNSSLISDFISDHSIFGSAFNDSIDSFKKFNKNMMGLTHDVKRDDEDVLDEAELHLNPGGRMCDFKFDNLEKKTTPSQPAENNAETDYDEIDDDEREGDEFDDDDEDDEEDEVNDFEEEQFDSDSNNEDEDEDLDSNIFDYDLENADEENYFNRYDFDYNSYCFKSYLNNYNELQSQQRLKPILSSNTIVESTGENSAACNYNICRNVQSKMLPSLSTSVHSIPSSSNHAASNNFVDSHKSFYSGKAKMTPVSGYSSKNNYIYQKLNQQRLKLVDMLLKNGADKYLVGKLSYQNVEKLNRKSFFLLKKWYGIQGQVDENFDLKLGKTLSGKEQNGQTTAVEKPISKSSSVFSLSKLKHGEQRVQTGDGGECEGVDSYGDCTSQGGSGTDQRYMELRPLSPIMASLCLDDVDLFARLYKHHQTLFNYFKPDEDYELIYYAIKFQSKSCLIYLLSNTNSDACFPSLVFEKASDSYERSKCFGHNKVPRTVCLNQNTKSSNSLATEPNVSNQLELQLSKSVNTMFYILENTRSAKIVKVLLRCGFDLTKREPLTGNTALHCIFNASKSQKYYDNNQQFNAKQKMLIGTKRCILNEFPKPKSLSRILFVMLKMGGLKTHVNTLNNDKKLCSQVLFEWDELIERVFFLNYSENSKLRNEWKREFKQCVKLLLKSGADMLFNTKSMNGSETHSEHHNCLDVLFTSLLKHVLKNQNEKAKFSPGTGRASSPNRNANHFGAQGKLYKYDSQCIVFDVDFLYTLLNDCIDLNTVTTNLMRQNHYYHLHHSMSSPQNVSNPESPSHRILPKECIVEKFIEILLHVRIESFASAFKILKLICHFQKCFNLKYRFKINSVSPQLVKLLVDKWINDPCFLNSSFQFEKNRFVKLAIFELILNDLLDPNDNTVSYLTMSESDEVTSIKIAMGPANHQSAIPIESNSLLNHCVKLLFTNCKTGYQIELIADLMRTLVQYGARPCLNTNYSSHSPESFINSVCDLIRHVRLSKREEKLEFRRANDELFLNTESAKSENNHLSVDNHHHHHHHHHHHNHHHHHHHHRHHKRHKHKHRRHRSENNNEKRKTKYFKNKNDNYFLDYFKGKTQTGLSKSQFNISTFKSQNEDTPKSTSMNQQQKQNQLLANSNAILLLTPSPSYLSLLHINNFTVNQSPNVNLNSASSITSLTSHLSKSNNIVIESSILYLRQFKKLFQLLISSIESNYPHNNIKHNHYLFVNSEATNCFDALTSRCLSSDILSSSKSHQWNNMIEFSSFDILVNKISSQPKSLKSQARRYILNQLVTVQKKQKSDNTENRVLLIKNQVFQLPLPKRIQNYLLFIHN